MWDILDLRGLKDKALNEISRVVNRDHWKKNVWHINHLTLVLTFAWAIIMQADCLHLVLFAERLAEVSIKAPREKETRLVSLWKHVTRDSVNRNAFSASCPAAWTEIIRPSSPTTGNKQPPEEAHCSCLYWQMWCEISTQQINIVTLIILLMLLAESLNAKWWLVWLISVC